MYVSYLLPVTFPHVKHRTGIIKKKTKKFSGENQRRNSVEKIRGEIQWRNSVEKFSGEIQWRNSVEKLSV
jgi:hypothetical protein